MATRVFAPITGSAANVFKVLSHGFAALTIGVVVAIVVGAEYDELPTVVLWGIALAIAAVVLKYRTKVEAFFIIGVNSFGLVGAGFVLGLKHAIAAEDIGTGDRYLGTWTGLGFIAAVIVGIIYHRCNQRYGWSN